MYAALGQLISFHNKDQVLIKNCCYGNSLLHSICAILAAIVDFSKFLSSVKVQQIFLTLVENMFWNPQIRI